MQYLKRFDNEEEYIAFLESRQMVRPNVSLIKDTSAIYFNKLLPFGVYIQHKDGGLHTESEWVSKGFANSDANGVAIIDNDAQFVIAKTHFTGAWSSDTSGLVDGLPTLDTTNARVDYNGPSNTRMMLATDASGAAYKCSTYKFPNGKYGYLPSGGELVIAYKYKDAVDSAMTAIGGSDMKQFNAMWASTQSGATGAFQLGWNSTIKFDTQTKSYTNTIRPFSLLY